MFSGKFVLQISRDGLIFAVWRRQKYIDFYYTDSLRHVYRIKLDEVPDFVVIHPTLSDAILAYE